MNMKIEVTENIAPEIAELLYQYVVAFSCLYGIIPVAKALEIIRDQNPDIVLTDEQFWLFAEQAKFPHCIISGTTAVADRRYPPADPEGEEIISEYLYYFDFGQYEELKGKQKAKQYYIPCREELLRYAEPDYFERTEQYDAFLSLLRDDLSLKMADEFAEDLRLTAHMSDGDLRLPLRELEWKRYTNFGGFTSTGQAERFIQAYIDLFNNTRKHEHRGHTPIEADQKLSGTQVNRVWMKSDFDYGTVRKVQKTGRNELCPCGSGKKFKKCCIGKGIYD